MSAPVINVSSIIRYEQFITQLTPQSARVAKSMHLRSEDWENDPEMLAETLRMLCAVLGDFGSDDWGTVNDRYGISGPFLDSAAWDAVGAGDDESETLEGFPYPWALVRAGQYAIAFGPEDLIALADQVSAMLADVQS